MSDDKFKLAWETICELPNGSTLYREPNHVGGHTYWSDEVGGGVFVWDTALVDAYTLLAAVAEEQRRAVVQRRDAYAPSQPKAPSDDT